MAPSTKTNEPGGIIELRNTNNFSANRKSDGGDVDFDDKIREVYDRSTRMGGDGKTSPFTMGPRKDGLQRLPSRVDDDFEDRADSVATAEAIENAEAAPGDRGDDGAGTVVYKVYKRRWFGLLQLTLINILVSWDVSRCFSSRRICFFAGLVCRKACSSTTPQSIMNRHTSTYTTSMKSCPAPC